MAIGGFSKPRTPKWVLGALMVTTALVGACSTLPKQGAAVGSAGESPSKQAQPIDAAVTSMTTALFANANLDPSEQRILVVDPPVDQSTVRHSTITRDVERRVLNTVSQRYPNIHPSAMGEAALLRQPIVLLSCMSPVTAAGDKTPYRQGPAPAYRVWASLSDTRTGKIVSSETAWVRSEDVDVTPTKFFRDSPVWSLDHSMRAYLKVCGGKPGETMDQAYLTGMDASAVADRGTSAYEAGRYEDALADYTAASTMPEGDRMRVWNGMYLTNMALGRPQAAEAAFGKMVDLGLAQGNLAVKFLFKPASAQFWTGGTLSQDYPMWLREIASRSAAQRVCMLVLGHTSPTGPRAVNESLSERRAKFVRQQIVERAPVLKVRLEALGRGSSDTLVGTGQDDATDALDRRVDFEPQRCNALEVAPDRI